MDIKALSPENKDYVHHFGKVTFDEVEAGVIESAYREQAHQAIQNREEPEFIDTFMNQHMRQLVPGMPYALGHNHAMHLVETLTQYGRNADTVESGDVEFRRLLGEIALGMAARLEVEDFLATIVNP